MFFRFSQNETTDLAVTKEELGGKGYGLVKMSRDGIRVPPGFVISTDVCRDFLSIKGKAQQYAFLSELAKQARTECINFINVAMAGHTLVSVRSGARVSMPGMMDTILNVGISNANLEFYSKKLGHRTAFDVFRRLIMMYGVTVENIDPARFKAVLKTVMSSKYDQPEPPKTEAEMSLTHLNKLVTGYLACYRKYAGEDFPEEPEVQLKGAIGAVFKSWNSSRAIAYRVANNIPHDWYTACVVQAMVFGNANEQSCSGVLFSRNPSNGSKYPVGEYLPNAQGEEVVSGTVTPYKIEGIHSWNLDVGVALYGLADKIESKYKDMVDIEFTVESGILYILQARVGKRTASAAFQIAYDLVQEGVISKEEALKRLTPEQYQTLTVSVIDPTFKGEPIATGLAGSKGIATGKVWLSKEKSMQNPGGILVTKETTPDDYAGMSAAAGILTQTGGITSHAALVARSLEKACVVGCTDLVMVETKISFVGKLGDPPAQIIDEGDFITIDGSTGRVFVGDVPKVGGIIPSFVTEMIGWGAVGKMIQYELSDELPIQGEVCLSLAKFKDAVSVFSAIAYLNKERPQLRGILSLSNAPVFDDRTFLMMMGIPTTSQGVTAQQIAGLAMFNHDDVHIGKNWTVTGLESIGPIDNVKFHIHRKSKTIKELMDCHEYYEADDELAKLLKAQGLSVVEFVELLKKTGKSLKYIAKPISKSQLAFRVLGK